MRPFTAKQLDAVIAGTYGRNTSMIHRLATQLQRELALSDDLRSNVARSNADISEREYALTRLRPEHERVRVIVTRPLGERGLPAIEVHADARVKVSLELPGDSVPRGFEGVHENYPSLLVLPPWVAEYCDQE